MNLGYSFEMVTTNCETGRCEYLQERNGNKHRLNEIARASSSLPYVSKIVEIDGIPMLDGGIIDSIPLLHAIEKGHCQNVVICTRTKGGAKLAKILKYQSLSIGIIHVYALC